MFNLADVPPAIAEAKTTKIKIKDGGQECPPHTLAM